MAQKLSGAPVTAALNERLRMQTETLRAQGVTPRLALVRLGERPDDLSYETGAVKRCESIGVETLRVTLPADCGEATLIAALEQLNADDSVHGILLFRPLPPDINDAAIRAHMSVEKDVDGITDASLTGVFTDTDRGFAPCTAEACLVLLDHYGIELKGRRVVVIGRSLVVGKPLAMLLLRRHATVTICHTRSRNLPSLCREAELLIAAAGRAGVVDARFLSPGQTVLDVGINLGEDGKLCGDVSREAAESLDIAFTPVPGGLGTVTTSVLAGHVVLAAQRQVQNE